MVHVLCGNIQMIFEVRTIKKGHLALGCWKWLCMFAISKKQPSVKIVIWDCEIERLHLLLDFAIFQHISSRIVSKYFASRVIFLSFILYHKKRIITSTLPMLEELAQGTHSSNSFNCHEWKRNLFLVGEGGLYVEDLCNYIHDRGDLPLNMFMLFGQPKYILKWKPQALPHCTVAQSMQ